jgi:hypothetical protein
MEFNAINPLLAMTANRSTVAAKAWNGHSLVRQAEIDQLDGLYEQ